MTILGAATHKTERGDHDFDHVSVSKIILRPTQSIRGGWPQLGSNPGPPQLEALPLPTELPHPVTFYCVLLLAQKAFMCQTVQPVKVE